MMVQGGSAVGRREGGRGRREGGGREGEEGGERVGGMRGWVGEGG